MGIDAGGSTLRVGLFTEKLECFHLEEFQEMFDTFGEYPEAILRILNGEDKEAVAVDFDLLQMG